MVHGYTKHTEDNEYQSSSCAGAAWHDPFVHYTHSAPQDAFSCVSPVVYKNQFIGSVARISGDGLLVSSNHIFVEKVPEDHSIWRSPSGAGSQLSLPGHHSSERWPTHNSA